MSEKMNFTFNPISTLRYLFVSSIMFVNLIFRSKKNGIKVGQVVQLSIR